MAQFFSWLNKIIYQRDVELISSHAKKDMDLFIIQSMFGNVLGVVVGGSFLMGYLLYLGASDAIVSYIPVIPSVCGILVVFCSNIVEKYDRRKGLVVCLNMITKSILVSIVFVPLFVSKEIAIPIVYFLLVLGYSFNMITALVVNTLIVEIIPINIRGRYFSSRQILTVLVSAILPVVAGIIVDSFDDKYHSFLILYGIAIVAAVFETITFSKLSNPVMKNIKKTLKLKELICIPLRNKEFMNFTIRVACFQFLWNMSMSFAAVHALKYIGVSYTYLNAISTINFICQIFITYKFWGVVNDRISPYFAYFNSMWFYMLDTTVWFFISSSTIYLIFPFAHIFGSINSAGFTVGSFNRRFQLIPEEGKLIYESFFAGFIGIALLLSPLAGNFIRESANKLPFVNNFENGNFKVAYLLTILGIFILQMFNWWDLKKNNPDSEILKKESYKKAIAIFKEVILRR